MTQDVATREAYGRTLVRLGEERADLVVLDADLSKSTYTTFFAQRFPERFFNVGIAEQNMIGIAAGLAAAGKTVFVSTFAVFAPGRCYDQIRMSIAQPHQNVKIAASHGGITVGEDGVSHQAVEDLALAASFPGFTVIVPADAYEAEQMVRVAAETYGPFYLRLGRPAAPRVCPEGYQFTIGQAGLFREGADATIIALGSMVKPALDAAAALALEGVSCRVLNMSSLKPIDEEAIVKAAAETGAIVTAEEHLLHGGLGAAVAQVLAENRPAPMEFVAIMDTYAESGRPNQLLHRYGLTAEDIARAVRAAVGRKG